MDIFIVTVLRMGLYMKLLKKRTIILALTLAAVFMLIGCSNTAQPQISGKLLFEIENCDSIELQIGSSEYKAKKQKEIDNISALMTSLTLKKVNIDDLEGGISVIVNTPDKKALSMFAVKISFITISGTKRPRILAIGFDNSLIDNIQIIEKSMQGV